MPQPNPLSILWDPLGFIRLTVAEKPRVGLSAAIVSLYLVLGMISLIVLSQRILNSIPEAIASDDARKMFLFGNSLTVIFWGLGGLLMWVIGSGILSSLCILLDGDADFRKVLEYGGYAHLPLLLFSLGLVVFGLAYHPTLDLPARSDLPKELLVQEVKSALDKELGSIKFRAIASFLWCCTVWQFILWTLALKQAGKLSYAKSAACTAALILLLGVILYFKVYMKLDT